MATAGTLLAKGKDKLARWAEQLQEVLNGPEPTSPAITLDPDELPPSNTKKVKGEEVKSAIKQHQLKGKIPWNGRHLRRIIWIRSGAFCSDYILHYAARSGTLARCLQNGRMVLEYASLNVTIR